MYVIENKLLNCPGVLGRADGQLRDGIVSVFFEQIVDGFGKQRLHGHIPVKAKLAQLLMGLGRQRGGDFLFSSPCGRVISSRVGSSTVIPGTYQPLATSRNHNKPTEYVITTSTTHPVALPLVQKPCICMCPAFLIFNPKDIFNCF